MPFLFRTKAIIPAWVALLVLVALFQWPMTVATAVLLLFVGIVPPTILLILSREPSLTVAEVLHRTETSQTK
ncbi:MAG TPA: hypothetical protein VH701_18840 [Vicinamibacterales bacterium]|jgi:hypothetical protein